MPMPKGKFELIQEIVNPLLIMEKVSGFTIAFSFQCLAKRNILFSIETGFKTGHKITIGMNYDEELGVIY